MGISIPMCPMKFQFAYRRLSGPSLFILDIGCGNQSPTTTKRWFPGCHYAGADIQEYNNSETDIAAMDAFYLLGIDGSGYSAIPDNTFDFIIMNHVVEHMPDPAPILSTLCRKLKPGGYIWIAFPSLRSLSLPSAVGTLQFCDDPSHVHVPDVREVSNILLANGIKVLHAGRSKSLIRFLIGAVVLPFRALQKITTGHLIAHRLWYVMGFEDHVFGQRRQL